MEQDDDEEKRLRSAALQNAQSIRQARQRADEDLVRAKEELELKTKELAHSLAMMRATFESTTDGILVTDGSGNVTAFNENYVQMWHVPSEIMALRDHRQILRYTSQNFADPQQFLARIEEIYATSPPESYELLQLADGRVFERFSKIQFVDGQIVGRVWSSRDITTRRRAEEALAKQSEQLRVTLASIGDAVIATDTQGRVVFLNGVAESLTGWRQSEAAGQPLDVVFHIVNEDSREPVDNPATRALAEGVIVGLANHTILIAKDGTERPIDDSAAPIMDALGNVTGAVLVFRDVTTHRRAERDLKERADLSAFQAEMGVVLTYCETVEILLSRCTEVMIHHLSGALARIWTLNEKENLLELQASPRMDTQADDPYRRVAIGQYNIGLIAQRRQPMFISCVVGDARIEEQEWARREGMVAFVGYPLLVEDRLVGVMAMFARRELSKAALQALGSVASSIALAIEQKRQAQELRTIAADLAEADRRKNEFLAMLAHELRNPLAPIRNALQIMKMTYEDGPAVQSASEMMERQVGQMVRLVEDLLDVSRISRGRIDLRRERIQLAAVVNQALEAARSLAAGMDHELIVDLPPLPVYLNADPTRLAQIIGNLLSNACKFTNQGGRIWLTVKLEGGQAVIRVRDNGIGIDATHLPRIFEMFMQIDTSLERTVSGLGIGLTLVKNLTDMHGGSVEVHSAGVGQGSEFVVRLPIMMETPEPPPDEVVGKPQPQTARRILVVDDNRDSAMTLAMLLKLRGNVTQTAYDGIEAVEAAEIFRPDVVLLDIGLPRMNGYEAARKIREQSWGADMSLVALTGWGQDEDRRKSQEAGFNGHLVKPVELADLMKLLADLTTTRP
jgi:PAS domain S-box-containing protein